MSDSEHQGQSGGWEAALDDACARFTAAMTRCGTTREALAEAFKDWQPGANHSRRAGERIETGAQPAPPEMRYRAALEAIANAEIPGVSGGPNGASRLVMAFARQALRPEPCATCNIDGDGTRIYPDGQGALDCPACHGTGDSP